MMENITAGQASLKFGEPIETCIFKDGKRLNELQIPLVVELDDAALGALIGVYRKAELRGGDVNIAEGGFDGKQSQG
jgi:hypothetical protein